MLLAREVTKVYRSGDVEVAALDGVNFQLPAGAFASITGPSGCGKSTLLSLLGGLDVPTSGEILSGGLALHKARDKELTHYRRTQLGFVFQFFNLIPGMTVLENVELPLVLRGDRRKTSRDQARDSLEAVGMLQRAGHFPHQLSGGEMQRTAIARAIVHQPAVVLADEPTGNLDSRNAERVMECILDIASRRTATFVIVTHSEAIAELAPTRIHLKDGRIDFIKNASSTHPV